jgi:hypothetical protein
MKRALILFVAAALVCFACGDAEAVKNGNGKWALHDAGPHNSKTNNCDFVVTDCVTQINTVGGGGGSRDDIYVIAVDVFGIAGTRYGICCDGPFWFYGWTKCSDFEIPTAGWPGCGEANAQTWGAEVAGPHVTLGILDVYVYPSSVCMCVCDDPRVGFAEFCDGTEPSPICVNTGDGTMPGGYAHFGCVEFNGSGCGYNPCSFIPVEQRSWGSVKSLYR